MKEVWKDIKGFEGKYKVSNFGRVKSLPRTIVYIKDDTSINKKIKERIMRQSLSGRGYLKVGLSDKGVVKHRNVHRIVAEAFLENKLNKKEVNHKDNNKKNNNVNNLEWVTISENKKHAFNIGVAIPPVFKGEDHYNSKFSNREVKNIREMYKKGGWSYKTLAEKLNVGRSTIARIINKQTYKGDI